ncbi:GTPase Era [Paraburkholderia hiiakae]|uniref:GTPase Era n=1 Tax=Paraburkholderia hiiakae TaxID=1081782 RepID=A0ABM8P940_9BURK|nr:GTPase [Paraburkholderia hiiakae]CAD6559600.1 GTPase Era [Paraburkholderia hiiakae]
MDLTVISELLPERAADAARFAQLADAGKLPVVTVLGKFNHGKSTLLNELIGQGVFAVSDVRQTTDLDAFDQEGVRWLDAPGLDADVQIEDDRRALRGSWEEADIRLFVHSAREGELDGSEKALLAQLAAEAAHSRREVLVVITQIEEVGEETLADILRIIKQQAASLEILPVSAIRYRRGREGGKPLLIEKSGMLALKDRIAHAVRQVFSARAEERRMTGILLRAQLASAGADRYARLKTLTTERNRLMTHFKNEFESLQADIHRKIGAI